MGHVAYVTASTLQSCLAHLHEDENLQFFWWETASFHGDAPCLHCVSAASWSASATGWRAGLRLEGPVVVGPTSWSFRAGHEVGQCCQACVSGSLSGRKAYLDEARLLQRARQTLRPE